MKKSFLALSVIFLLFSIAFTALAQEKHFSKSEYIKMRNFYLKKMNTAHPLPAMDQKDFSIYDTKKYPILQGDYVEGSDFKNSNTIIDESEFTKRMQNESSVAINPTNPENLIASAVDYRDNSSTWVYVSNDGGYTWENHNLGKPFPNWRSTNDPSVGFSAEGVAYLMYGGFEIDNADGNFNGGNAIFCARSFDSGATWDAHNPVIIHTSKQTIDSAFEDKYYIESDNSDDSDFKGRIYTPWKRVIAADSSTQIMFASSDDNGKNWTDPEPISPRLPRSSEDTTYGQSFPLLEVTANGHIHAVWNNGIYHAVGYNRSIDGGENWDDPELIKHYNIFGTTKLLPNGYRHTVKGKVRAESYPIIRSDHSDSERRGWIYLVWTADSIPNVYFSRSEDDGLTWSDAKMVNQDETNDQFWAWLAVDPDNGDIGVMYFDSRRDPDNMMVECWVSLSQDGGDTWVDRSAGSNMIDLRLNPFTANSFAGDYSGMDFSNGMMYPTWVDMRFAGENLSDSDVFTAVIDTRAPLPPSNLTSVILPQDPEIINLTWECPIEFSFGQTLYSEDYELVLLKNGEIVDTLIGGTSEIIVEGLTPHELVDFEIYTTADDRRSKAINISTYPGGSAQPGAPIVQQYSGYDNLDVVINVKLPNKRKDGVTPLVNMKGLNIYRDGELFETHPLMASDTNQTIEIKGKVDVRGWYSYSFEIFDEYGGVENISDASIPVLVYAGVAPLSDNNDYYDSFDTDFEKYHVIGEWAQNGEFFITPDYSLSIAKEGIYGNNQSDTLLFYPIDASEPFIFNFWHAAIVHSSDKACLQMSKDDGLIWTELESWGSRDNDFWSDSELNHSDWKRARFTIDETDVETVLLRFVFVSNQIKNDFGWYIDDLFVSRDLNNIDEDKNVKILVYPNPVSKTLNIVAQDLYANIQIYNILGEKVIDQKNHSKESIVDVSNLPNGTYFLRIGDNIEKFIKY